MYVCLVGRLKYEMNFCLRLAKPLATVVGGGDDAH